MKQRNFPITSANTNKIYTTGKALTSCSLHVIMLGELSGDYYRQFKGGIFLSILVNLATFTDLRVSKIYSARRNLQNHVGCTW